MQLFLKKLVTLNILIITFFCNQTIFGMILSNSHLKGLKAIKKQQDRTKKEKILTESLFVNNLLLPNEVIIDIMDITSNGDGKIKNKLRLVNKFFANRFSIQNDHFLLTLNKNSITETDVQNILLNALWRDGKEDKKIVEDYKSRYNSNEEISLKNIFGSRSLSLLRLSKNLSFCLEENICCCESKKFEKIKKTKQLLFNGEKLNTQKDMWQMLQIAALCNDKKLVQEVSRRITTISDPLLWPLSEILLLWLMLIGLNKKEMFRFIVNTNPLNIDHLGFSINSSIFKNEIEKMNITNKDEYIQILETAKNNIKVFLK